MKHTTWNLTHLFKSDDDPQIEKQRVLIEKKSYEFISKWKNRSDYLRDPAVLKQALAEYEAWRAHYSTDGAPGYYFWLRTQQDHSSPGLKARHNKIEEFSKKVGNDIRFFQMRIAKIPPAQQKRFLAHKGLIKYRHFLERIFAESRYLLSEPEEKIISLKTSTSYANWVRMTNDFLTREERTVVLENGSRGTRTFSEILSMMNSKKKQVRDAAARAFNAILRKHVDVAEAEINSILADKKVDDELRGTTRPDLTRHISDDIDTDIVDALVESVSSRYDISSGFYRLLARLLKVKKLKYHERNVEYGSVRKKYPYDESVKRIRKVFGNLDSQFADIFDGFIKNGQFDVYPRKGKGSGAFCVYNLISQPTYILLNYTDKLSDVLTMAHELGHGINNELIRERQHALNFGTPVSTAEVASTFMEDFVLEDILQRADDELKLAIMVRKLHDDVSTIFRQVACYTFEQELHRQFREKGYLSKKEIGILFRKHMSAYMGDAVEQSAGSENWWVYWSHIRAFFYVYSYASGLLISKSLQNTVKKDRTFIRHVKTFLSAGLADSPRNIFMKLGIDIANNEFWGKGLDRIDALLQDTEALAKKMGKI